MVNFSTNQVMQFYVCDGTETVATPAEGKAIIKFENGASDVIENVEYAVYTPAANLATKTKSVSFTVTADTNAKGQDLVVRVKYPAIGGTGVEGWVVKTAATRGTVAATVAEELKDSLNKAFEADNVLVASNSGATVTINVVDNTKFYKRGVKPIVPVDFTVETNQIVVDGKYEDWTSEPVSSEGASISGSYKLADLEYFAMGERADQYRGMGYPDVIDTEYKVDVKQSYDVINIHYAYKGYNQNSHKSEKDIFIVGTTANVKKLGGLLEGALKAEIKNLPA